LWQHKLAAEVDLAWIKLDHVQRQPRPSLGKGKNEKEKIAPLVQWWCV